MPAVCWFWSLIVYELTAFLCVYLMVLLLLLLFFFAVLAIALYLITNRAMITKHQKAEIELRDDLCNSLVVVRLQRQWRAPAKVAAPRWWLWWRPYCLLHPMLRWFPMVQGLSNTTRHCLNIRRVPYERIKKHTAATAKLPLAALLWLSRCSYQLFHCYMSVFCVHLVFLQFAIEDYYLW